MPPTKLTADLLADPTRWEGRARSPIQLLMQYDQDIDEVEYGHPEGYGDERYPDQLMAFADGRAAAFLFALKSTQAEVDHAVAHNNYTSWGDDTRDYYENGREAGLRWSAGLFEWREDEPEVERPPTLTSPCPNCGDNLMWYRESSWRYHPVTGEMERGKQCERCLHYWNDQTGEVWRQGLSRDEVREQWGSAYNPPDDEGR